MVHLPKTRSIAAILTAAMLALTSPALGQTAEKPVAPERSPPGDIPDSQVFITYTSPLGFVIKVPEGWSRMEQPQSVRFVDKYNTVEIGVSAASAAPTAASVKNAQVPELLKAGRAVTVVATKDVQIGGLPAVLITYSANSDPNAVTNKQIRLEHDRYLFFSNSRLATLDMSAPQGADNVDDWALIARSFRWQ